MIKRIRIQNYRSLVDVTVDLGPVTVLIGRSGAGKTNFVHAIRLLRNALQSTSFDNAASASDQGGWNRIVAPWKTDNVPVRFDLTFDAPGAQGEIRYAVVRNVHRHNVGDEVATHPPQILEERLQVGDQVVFHQLNRAWRVDPKIDGGPSPGNLVLSAASGNREISLSFIALTDGIGCYDFPGNVMQSGSSTSEGGLVDDGRNYMSALQGIVTNLREHQRWSEIIFVLRKLQPAIRDVQVRPGGPRTVVSREVRNRMMLFDVAQESEGFRRLLAQMLALYQVPSKQTLIFEEPEKGIYPMVLQMLAEEYKLCPQQGRGQVVLTTHSPELLDHFDAEEIRVVEMENQETRISPLAPDQLQSVKDRLLKAGELLTIDEATSQRAVFTAPAAS